jgi:beta-glucosidase
VNSRLTKVDIEPGSEATVIIPLDKEAFSYWDLEANGWVVASGTYRIHVAHRHGI